MKASFFSLLAAAGIASAASGLPTCANTCVASFTSSTSSTIDGCSTGDYKCICSNDDFLNGVACCLKSNCDSADQATAVLYADTLCKTFGVTVPSTLACKSTSNSTSTTSSNSTSTTKATPTSSTSAAKTAGAASTAGSVGMVGLIGGLLAAML